MSDENILQLITEEFKCKTLGVTEQYLEIHNPVYENGQLKIARIDREESDDQIIAYLPVNDEYFYFAVYIDMPAGEIINIGTESRNIVALEITSETLTVNELKSFIKLTPTRFWNKGDLKPNGRSTYSFNYLEIQPNPEPDSVEDKLKKVLQFLKTDMEGVVKISQKAKARINVAMDFHYGNQFLGATNINLECIDQLKKLNLSLNFDFTAWGQPFK